jgi:phage tail-like protein
MLAVVAIGFLAATSSLVADSAPFAVNPTRFDPYKQCKFRVKWDGRYIAGISSVSGLVRRTEIVVHREGGTPSSDRRSPGLTNYDPIILERGLTHDTEFEKWANKVWNFGSGLGGEVSLEDFRKDIVIELYNEAGQLVMAWKVYRCWPSKYVAVSSLNADRDLVLEKSARLGLRSSSQLVAFACRGEHPINRRRADSDQLALGLRIER